MRRRRFSFRLVFPRSLVQEKGEIREIPHSDPGGAGRGRGYGAGGGATFWLTWTSGPMLEPSCYPVTLLKLVCTGEPAPYGATGEIPKCSRTESVCSGENGRPHQVMRMDRGMRFMYASLVPSPFFRGCAGSWATHPHPPIAASRQRPGQLRSKDRGAFFCSSGLLFFLSVSCCYFSNLFSCFFCVWMATEPDRQSAQQAMGRVHEEAEWDGLLGDDLW